MRVQNSQGCERLPRRASVCISFFCAAVMVLLPNFSAATLCLTPVQSSDECSGGIIYPAPTPKTRKALLLRGDKGALCRWNPAGSTFELVPTKFKITEVVNNWKGVYLIGKIGASGIYRYVENQEPQLIFNKEEREQFIKFYSTKQERVYALMQDQVFEVIHGENPRKIPAPIPVEGKFVEGFVAADTVLLITDRFDLYRIVDDARSPKLVRVDQWQSEFGAVSYVLTAGDTVYIWDRNRVFRLDRTSNVTEVTGALGEKSDGINAIHDLYYLRQVGLFASTSRGMFHLSHSGTFNWVPGDFPGMVHSIHALEHEIFILAANGVFHLERGEELRKVEANNSLGVAKAGIKTSDGVFFIDSDAKKTFQLTNSGKILPVPLPQDHEEMPEHIMETTKGILLYTKESPNTPKLTSAGLYRFAKQHNRWSKIPSKNLGRAIEVKDDPINEKDSSNVFIQSSNGIFRWIDSSVWIDPIESLECYWMWLEQYWREGNVRRKIFVVVLVVVLIGVCVWTPVFWKHHSIRRRDRERKKVGKKIFINYRQKNVRGYANTLYMVLCEQFHKQLIFLDESLKRGDKLTEELDEAVDRCSVLLALIGPDWLDAKSDSGNRLLDNPEDWVRMEIVQALKDDKVLPVLVGGAEMPDIDLLPEPLKPLTDILAVELTEGGDKLKQEVYKKLALLLASKYPDIPTPKAWQTQSPE